MAHFIEKPVRAPEPGELLISEIHYNPDGSDEFEFIELYNASDSVLDLSSLKISEGVEFLFPARSYLNPQAVGLIVENREQFDLRYGDPDSDFYSPNLTIFGQWSGQLSNGGERLQIVTLEGDERVSLAYGTSLPWPEEADGGGASLELRAPELDSSEPGSWRASIPNGTPGRAFESATGPSPGQPLELWISPSDDSDLLLLEFVAEQGASYEVQHSKDLHLGEWAPFHTIREATEGIISLPLVPVVDGELNFFRVLRLP